MTVVYRGLTPSSRLGEGYSSSENVALRATFEAAVPFGLDFEDGMADVIDRVKALGYVLPLNTEPVLDSATVAVIDLHVGATGRTVTAAQLANDLNEADWRVRLSQLARVDIRQATGTTGGDSRQGEQSREQKSRDASSAIAQLTKLAKIVLWLALLAAVCWALVKIGALRASLA